MPFPELNALGFDEGEDAKYMNEEAIDPAIRKEFEGGFVSTRPRYTRAPRRKIVTGFTDISNANKELLFAFYDLVRGGSGSFTYNHPVSGDFLSVRFLRPFGAKYAGIGGIHRWDIANIEMETV